MLLSSIVEDCAERAPDLGWAVRSLPESDLDIAGVRLDSRAVGAADLFCCVPGATTDGHAYASEAVERGAAALLVDHWLDDLGPGTTQILVTRVRPAMAWAAAAFHQHPSAGLRTVGVTGTNGKTTTTHLVKAVLDHLGCPSGLVGTLTGARTTPEAPHLQAALRAMVDDGLEAVAMEVSSHALAQDRVTGTRFDVAVFTNLTAEHLDYHGSMEAYFEAKASLFTPDRIGAAVINRDDPHGARLIATLGTGEIVVGTFSIDDAAELELRLDGSTFMWRGEPVRLALPGLFNVANALAAAETVRLLGFEVASVADGLSAAPQVPGRFEVVAGPSAGGPSVIVDYSHTPAGLEQVLTSVRRIEPHAEVHVVFGAGGERDREKRPLMGGAAEAHADHVTVTSDNPRGEDPDTIIQEILTGLDEPARAIVEPDRRRAIRLALDAARPGDIVVIAGKGHETTQTIGDRVIPFDDRAIARELLEQGVDR